jgi:hypothetical protein
MLEACGETPCRLILSLSKGEAGEDAGQSLILSLSKDEVGETR